MATSVLATLTPAEPGRVDPFSVHKDDHQRIIVVSKQYYYAYSGQRLQELTKDWDTFVETHREPVDSIPTYIHLRTAHPMVLIKAYEYFLMDRVITEDDKVTNKIEFTDEMTISRKEMLMIPFESGYVDSDNIDENVTNITNLVKNGTIYKIGKDAIDRIFPYVPTLNKEEEGVAAGRMRQLMITDDSPHTAAPARKGK
jgi:hypothetical protein